MEIALFSAKEKGRMKKLSFFHTSFEFGVAVPSEAKRRISVNPREFNVIKRDVPYKRRFGPST
jgi:hypothetical protein